MAKKQKKRDIFKYVKANQFFEKLAPVRNWRKKLSGKDSNGNTLDFNADDDKDINNGIDKLVNILTEIKTLK